MGRQKKRAGMAPKARMKANLAAEHAWEKVNPTVENARQRIGPAVEEARHRIGPAVDDAREKVGPAVEHARTVISNDVVPKVATAVSHAMTASEPYRTEAKRRGSAAYAALKGDVELPGARHRRRWPKLLLLVGALGGAAIAAYRYLRSGTDKQWEPMASTTPPSRSDVTGGAHQPMSRGGGGSGSHRGHTEAADTAGAGPDEAVADAPEAPHKPTTPDAPAEHTDTTNTTSQGSVPPQSGKDGGDESKG